jgi:hypothetical protein
VAYNASDTASLQVAFDTIFDDIFKKTSAFGSVSQNSTSINTGSVVFQGRFDSTDWTGEDGGHEPRPTAPWSTCGAPAKPAAFPAPPRARCSRFKPGDGGVEFKLLPT